MYKKLSDLLLASSSLAAIESHTRELDALQDCLCRALESPLNQHLIVANFDANTLILHADSPAWAAKLRFRIADILDIVKDSCKMPSIGTIRIKVVIPPPPAPAARPSISGPSAGTAEYLAGLARDCNDEKLARVLNRLASHGREE